MLTSHHDKIIPEHLQRKAYLYIRQSTLRQVFENTESTKRQYALRERAVQLGWSTEDIVVIDEDQGQSGASSTERKGFQRLVSEVGMGKAGIVRTVHGSCVRDGGNDGHKRRRDPGLVTGRNDPEDGRAPTR